MRPIDADALLSEAEIAPMYAVDAMVCYELIKNAQTLDYAPVVHGRWIDKGDYAVCTECDGQSGTQYDGVEPIPLMTQFCPHCGAKMDER